MSFFKSETKVKDNGIVKTEKTIKVTLSDQIVSDVVNVLNNSENCIREVTTEYSLDNHKVIIELESSQYEIMIVKKF